MKTILKLLIAVCAALTFTAGVGAAPAHAIYNYCGSQVFGTSGGMAYVQITCWGNTGALWEQRQNAWCNNYNNTYGIKQYGNWTHADPGTSRVWCPSGFHVNTAPWEQRPYVT